MKKINKLKFYKIYQKLKKKCVRKTPKVMAKINNKFSIKNIKQKNKQKNNKEKIKILKERWMRKNYQSNKKNYKTNIYKKKSFNSLKIKIKIHL